MPKRWFSSLLFLKKLFSQTKFRLRAGFTFIEVMVAISIFSLGVVSIMQVFRLSLDRIQHLTNRIYANYLIEDKISSIERVLRSQKSLPFDIKKEETVNVGAKTVTFDQRLTIATVDNFLNLFQVTLSLTWKEGGQTKMMSRSTYVTDVRLDN